MTVRPKLSLRASNASVAISYMKHAQSLSISHAGDCFGHKRPRNDMLSNVIASGVAARQSHTWNTHSHFPFLMFGIASGTSALAMTG